MHSERMTPAALLAGGSRRLIGAVLLAPARIGGRLVAKGTRIDEPLAGTLHGAAADGSLTAPLRLGWPGAGDLHEDEASRRLAAAVAGPGIVVGEPHQSRVDLSARMDGVLRVDIAALGVLNRIDPLEVFTLFHGQAVRAGRTVASVKVAPHLVEEAAVAAGEVVARDARPLVDVAPYLPLKVAAIAVESLAPEALERFQRSARAKVTDLGGQFLGVTQVADPDPDMAAQRLGQALRELAGREEAAVVLVGGVSAGDPLSPFYQALEASGGRLLRRGVPAHPGSMIWLGAVGNTTLLGLPQCGMFSLATAADLVLPRLLTGEQVTRDTLADFGHGGLLGPEMRFRFPDYARDLEAPE
jgi:hypothetical protein